MIPERADILFEKPRYENGTRVVKCHISLRNAGGNFTSQSFKVAEHQNDRGITALNMKLREWEQHGCRVYRNYEH